MSGIDARPAAAGWKLDRRDLDRVQVALGDLGHVEDIYPLAPLQQGLVFHSLYSPGSTFYISTHAVEMRGALDRDAMGSAWQRVVRRHSILRSVFVVRDLGTPLQVVLRNVSCTMGYFDVSDCPPQEQQRRLGELDAEHVRDFEFLRAPLMRVSLVRLAPEHHRLLWSCHHVLLDGWSTSILFNEVFSSYLAAVRNCAVRLPRAVPYRDYVAWLMLQDEERSKEYWTRRLAGFRAATTPDIRYSHESVSASADVPAAVAECIWNCPIPDATLNEFARRNRTTPSAVMLSVWLLLLSRYTRSNDVACGMTVSGRPSGIPGIETAVGLFINTLPLRITLDREMSAALLLSQVHGLQSELLEQQHSSLSVVHQCSQVRNRAPLFETNFVYENFPSAVPAGIESLVGLQMSVIYSTSRAHYPLVARVMPNAENGMSIAFEFDVRRFSRAAIERLASHYGRLLEGIVGDPDRRVSGLALLDEAERRQVLVDWNQTQMPCAQQRCVQELFAEQVRRSPEATALEDGEASLTYAELEKRASQVAHHLRGMGVGPDVIVGLCIERSIEMVVGLLGILKAGGAYLPLDPDIPAARLSYMLEDAGVTALVTGQGIGTPQQIDTSWEQILQGESITSLPLSDPEHLAYVIYTSGSTGHPKGVMVSHRGVVNYLSWARSAYPSSGSGRVPINTSVSFDATVTSLLLPLMSGGSLWLLMQDGQELLNLGKALCAGDKFALIKLTPTQLQELQQALWTVAVAQLRWRRW